MNGHAGSISLARKLNFGLRGTVMIVVEPLAAGDQREDADVGGGVVEILVADVVHSPLMEDESTNTNMNRVNAGRQQRHQTPITSPPRCTARSCQPRGRRGRG